MAELSYKPVVLYHASMERMDSARREFDATGRTPDYALVMYLSGLSVECVLQAIALRAGAAHDAKHSMSNWLAKCPTNLQDAIKGTAQAEWNLVVAVWDNGLRYLSQAGLLGYLRDKGRTVGMSGNPVSIVRENARRLLRAAGEVHKRGCAEWVSSTGK